MKEEITTGDKLIVIDARKDGPRNGEVVTAASGPYDRAYMGNIVLEEYPSTGFGVWRFRKVTVQDYIDL